MERIMIMNMSPGWRMNYIIYYMIIKSLPLVIKKKVYIFFDRNCKTLNVLFYTPLLLEKYL